MYEEMGRLMMTLGGVIGLFLCAGVSEGREIPEGETFTNSIGMKFVRVEPGEFQMGVGDTPLPWQIRPVLEYGRGGMMDFLKEGDWDEKPVHQVRITEPFYISVHEVTNAKYELFDPAHEKSRGMKGLSKQDNEAVIDVTWYEARAFCRWLSDQEGLAYRLPTEAEWEYACRAGTATHYHMGDILPKGYVKNPTRAARPKPVALKVGQKPANPWGLHDMHGNVEEWCHDWYGPYPDRVMVDPVGYADGIFKVTRGGSHNTYRYFLRSANRMGTLPNDSHWKIGFRVVIGPLSDTEPLKQEKPMHQRDVADRDPETVKEGPDADKPYFKGPRKYVKIPRTANGPLFAAHNHDPAIVACPNGDLLATWYTCTSEKDRELGLAASRLRLGAEEWERASPFFDAPDRNDHAPALWNDGKGKIYHFNGLSKGATYGPLALIMRTSSDSGRNWSKPRLIVPHHDQSLGLMPSEPVFRRQDGTIVLGTDRAHSLWMSRDEGLSWQSAEGRLPGTHPGIVELKDGRLLAFTRGGNINGQMPRCISDDGGDSWECKASQFQPIGGGQRLVLMRLQQGPLLFASFANDPMPMEDASGKTRKVRGLFVAVSEDEGKTWPYKRLVTPGGKPKPVECTDGGMFTLSSRIGEWRGYLSACQAPNEGIHLISSRQHYAFNLKWLKTIPPAPEYPPLKVRKVVETFEGPEEFDAEGWHPYKRYLGGFQGDGKYVIRSEGHFMGLNRVIGKGSFEQIVRVTDFALNPGDPDPNVGVSIGLKDGYVQSIFTSIKKHEISMSGGEPVTFAKSHPIFSFRIRFVWNEHNSRFRAFYGVNGAEATTELDRSKEGIYLDEPLTEATTAYILMSNGEVTLDHYEVRPLADK